MNRPIHLYQAYYLEEQKAGLIDWAIPLFNPSPTKHLENSLISELWQDVPEGHLVGLMSWKAESKLNKKITKEMFEGDYDIYTFHSELKRHEPLKLACEYHGQDFRKALHYLLPVNYSVPEVVPVACYSNYFVCTREVLFDYCFKVLTPAMLAWDISRSEINETLNRPQRYMRGRVPHTYTASTGLDYYPLGLFVLERLFMYYIANNTQWKVKQL